MNASDVTNILLGAVAVIATVCNIVTFFLNRRSAACAEGEAKGTSAATIKNISEQLNEIQSQMEKTADKTEERDRIREQEYRALLVAVSDVTSSYKSLHKRVDRIEEIVQHQKAEV